MVQSVLSEEDVAVDDVRPGDKLSFITKLAYGGGDFASQLVWSLGGSYLTIFYTDNVGLGAGVAAMILLVARIFDAILDPVIGAIAERTKSRWGRFRPWILFGTPFLAIMCVLTFMAPLASEMGKVIWAISTYFLLGIVYGCVNLPYGSLATVMSRKSDQRVALNSYRMVGTNLGAVVLSAVSMPLIIHFSGVGDGESTNIHGYTMTALVMAVIAVPIFYALFLTSKEVIKPIHQDREMPLKEELKIVLGNKQLLLVFTSFLLIMTGFFGRLGVQLYYYIYALGRIDLVSLLMMLPSLMGAVGIMLFARFAKYIGKRRMAMISFVVCGASLIALYFVPFDSIVLVILLTTVYGLGNFAAPLIMSMVPDCIDKAEDETGMRSDGLSYAVVSLSTKIGSAVGGAVGIALIGAFGYVPNAEQTAGALNGINLITNVGCGVLFLAGLIPMFFYDLDEDKYEEIRASLDRKQRLAEEAEAAKAGNPSAATEVAISQETGSEKD